jgi:hypothetical protein
MKYFIKKVLIACLVIGSSATQATEFFSHTVLDLPDDPRNENSWSQVINSQEDWESFFNATLAASLFLQGEAPTAPEFDFEKFQILTGGLGVKPSSGYILSVENVIELDDVIEIHVFDIRPGANCVTFAALTYPSTTILVEKTDKPFRFSVSQLVDECSE